MICRMPTGSPVDRSIPFNYFTNTREAIRYEANQIASLIDQIQEDDDVLFLDMDFPGLSITFAHHLRLMFDDIGLYSYLHAGSWCNGDIWKYINTWPRIERAGIEIMDKVYVATEYHRNLIQDHFNTIFHNLSVVGFPFYPEEVQKAVRTVIPWEDKNFITIVGRKEQSYGELEIAIRERYPGVQVQFADRPTQKDFWELLNYSKVMVSLKSEETFGITPFEALAVGCTPIVPDSFGYVDTMPKEFRYSNKVDMLQKINNYLNNPPITNVDIYKYQGVIHNILNDIKSRR